jgi:ligand-binding SRPBCC domain-containing protein
MPTITLETRIDAPIATCFDLARNIDVHCQSTSGTAERAVAGVTTGLMGMGDEVTFEAVHFGVRQRLSARVVEFDPPNVFVDKMVRGAFQSMIHVHAFRAEGNATVMNDTLTWTSPLGPLGKLADVLFLTAYMKAFIASRNAHLKQTAERVTRNN